MHFIINFFFQKLERICHSCAFDGLVLNLTAKKKSVTKSDELRQGNENYVHFNVSVGIKGSVFCK